MSSSGIIKVANINFGLSEDIYCTHYYQETSSVKLPIKWMSLESINDGFFNENWCGWKDILKDAAYSSYLAITLGLEMEVSDA